MKAVTGYLLEGVYSLLITLDGIIYNFICWFYEIFMYLAKLNLFSNEDYESIVRRIYIVLGVIMLFVLSYSLLKAIINPDEYAKGEKSFVNIVKNVIISLVIIVILPTVFDVAFRVQAVIINSDVIGKLILNENVGRGAVDNGGRTIASNVYRAFFSVNPDAQEGDYASDYSDIKGAVASAFDEVNRGESFLVFAGDYRYNGTDYNFPELVVGKAISYTFIISQLAGAFVLWCILLFCFDLGIRAIKLIYFQMIAPIAVACRVIPGSKAKEIFPNWVKKTVSTFMEVFIRIFIMYIGVYLITLLVDKFPDVAAAGSNAGLDFMQRLLVKAFLIMGIVAFIRQAPKLIQDVFGIESGGINLGLKGLTERFGAGGGFAAANGIGGLIAGRGVGGMFRGLRYGWSNNNLHGIGREAERRRLNRYARQHGATRGGIFLDQFRNVFGFDSRYDAEMRRIDAQIEAQDEIIDSRDRQIDEIKEELVQHHVSERIHGNDEAQSKIKDLKKHVEEEINKKDYDSIVTNGTTVVMLDENGSSMIGKNLFDIKEHYEKNSKNWTVAQQERYRKDMQDLEKSIMEQHYDKTAQEIATGGPITDAVAAQYIQSIRSEGVLSQALVDADGASTVTATGANAAIYTAVQGTNNLYKALKDLGNAASEANNNLRIEQGNVANRTRPLEYEKEQANLQKSDLQRQKRSATNVALHYNADTAKRNRNGGSNNGNS